MTPTGPVGGDVYFNTPGVATVRWDPTLATVLIEWQGWADSTEFMTLLTAGVRALMDHKGTRWLADCRRQKVLKPADQEWGDRVWLPRAVAAGLTRFAAVLPPGGLVAMNLRDKERTLRSGGVDVAYFGTVDEAKQWLSR